MDRESRQLPCQQRQGEEEASHEERAKLEHLGPDVDSVVKIAAGSARLLFYCLLFLFFAPTDVSQDKMRFVIRNDCFSAPLRKM
jgi:hypothetical protein